MKRKIHYIDIALRFQFRPKARPRIIAAARKLAQETIGAPDEDDESLEVGGRRMSDQEAAEHVPDVQGSIFEIVAANPLLEELGLEPIESVTSGEETAVDLNSTPRLYLSTEGKTLCTRALPPEFTAVMKKPSKGQRERRTKEINLNPELQQDLEQQLVRFREKFGREMGPDDPLFFDPDADEPKPIELSKLDADITEAMVHAGIEPAKIYAYRKTGMLPSQANWDKWTDADRAAWDAAISEYSQLTKRRN